MIGADDPDDGGLGYLKREGPTPKLVIVAIVWAGFGVFGLFTALLMHSSGFAVFGVLCLVAGVGLYFGQRTRDQLAYDELHLSTDPWTPPSDGPVDTGDDRPAADEDASGTTSHSRHDQDDDILDAEYTEYFDYEQSPADQDDGTGYDDEEVAYQRYQADHRARDIDGDDEDEFDDAAGEDDDVARTSRIPTGDADDHASSHDGATSHEGDRRDHDQHDSEHDDSDHEDREGSTGRRR
jgi:hypothetical protein